MFEIPTLWDTETGAYCFYIKLHAEALHSLKINKEIILWRHVWDLKKFTLLPSWYQRNEEIQRIVLLDDKVDLNFVFVLLDMEMIGNAMFHVFQMRGVIS